MKKKDLLRIAKVAREKNSREVDRLWDIYSCTDMDFDEFIGHLKIIAEE